MKRHILGAALIVLAGCTNSTAPAVQRTAPPGALETLQERSVEVLFWDDETRLDRFRRMEDLFPGIEVAPSPDPRPLPGGAPLPAAASNRLDEAIAGGDIVGVIVLDDGQVRYEQYAHGMTPDDRWVSFSMAKSVTATLLGAAIDDGFITDLAQPVTDYVPGLAGSAYDDVTIEQLLTMTSGVRWSEDYTDPESEVARLFVLEPDPGESQVVTLMKALPRVAPAGERFVYKTGETNLLGELVENAVGMPLAEYAKTKIVDPAGFENPMFWQTELTGGNIGGCCIQMTLPDYARFAQFILDGGADTVPADWIDAAGSTQVDFGNGSGYGYQWWTYGSGVFGAIGIFGQSITLFPEDDIALVVLSNWPSATGDTLWNQRVKLAYDVRAAITQPE